MLLRASGEGQLFALRALRFIEERALVPDGATTQDMMAVTGKGQSPITRLLRFACTANRAVRWWDTKTGIHNKYRYALTDQGRDWLDLQERYGAPPDQFRDPAAFAMWKASHPHMPFFVKVDLRVHPVRAVPWSSALGAVQHVPEFEPPWSGR